MNTWSAYWVSKAPPLTEAKKAAIRDLLMPRDTDRPPRRTDGS
jgi:hypothetical protein